MTYPELASFDSAVVKRGDEAVKIEWSKENEQRVAQKLVEWATPGEMFADRLTRQVNGMVFTHFNKARLDKIMAELPDATDAAIDAVGVALGIDLDIVVP